MPDGVSPIPETVNPQLAPKRKPGRPRKATMLPTPNRHVPTGAPIAETPQETVAGGGQLRFDPQGHIASPHSNETGSNAVADETGHSSIGLLDPVARLSAPQFETPAEMPVGGGQEESEPHLLVASPSTKSAACHVGDGGEVWARKASSPKMGMPDLSLLIEEIQQLQRKRIFCMKSDFRQANALMAEMRRLMDWTLDKSEAERSKINKRAMKLVGYAEKQHQEQKSRKELNDLPETAPPKVRRALNVRMEAARKAQEKVDIAVHEIAIISENRDIIVASYQGREVWRVLIEECESHMRKLAVDLPIFMWADGVRGLGPLGISIIIGETGNLSNYATKERVWKRLGLAVINGNRQGSPGRGATAEDWIEHGYKGLRRSQSWKINDSLIRAQWRGAKEDEDTGEIIDGHPLGVYGELYAQQKVEEHRRNDAGEYAAAAAQIIANGKGGKAAANKENLAGRLTRKHLDNKARRIVEKQLIEDMWRQWNRPRQEFQSD